VRRPEQKIESEFHGDCPPSKAGRTNRLARVVNS
jgi:hypothetical protein